METEVETHPLGLPIVITESISNNDFPDISSYISICPIVEAQGGTSFSSASESMKTLLRRQL